MGISRPTLFYSIWFILFQTFTLQAQEKLFTIQNLFVNNSLVPYGYGQIQWMNDGVHYTKLVRDRETESDMIYKYQIATGQKVEKLVDSYYMKPAPDLPNIRIAHYQFSPDFSTVLLAIDVQNIYRYSTKAKYYLYNVGTRALVPFAEESYISNPAYSPDSKYIAYVKDNNIYLYTVATTDTKPVTINGSKNKIINGLADWVYEEEFTMKSAFEWSPDSKKIAFLRFDEAAVPQYNLPYWLGNMYPEDNRYKYPIPGAEISDVSLQVYDINTRKTIKMETGESRNNYLPSFQWIPSNGEISFVKLNREQKRLTILHADPENGRSKAVLSFEDDNYVDFEFNNSIIYLKDTATFLCTSEKDGFKHIYYYQFNGRMINQVTKGSWEVTTLFGINESKQTLYYTSNEGDSKQEQLYEVKLDGTGKKRISKGEGKHTISFCPSMAYYIDEYSGIKKAPEFNLYNSNGELQQVLEANEKLQKIINDKSFPVKEFLDIEVGNGVSLNAYMIKPADFDATKKYPVMMFVYGGPGSQRVLDEWNYGGQSVYNYYLASKGFIVLCADNRGTGGKGNNFRQQTYSKLGVLEVQDQIEVAKYLQNLTYIDKERIGIWGWSYGGYMSTLCLFKSELFKAGIAVAPVTDWRLYDAVYTERYMNMPETNIEGYDDASVLSYVSGLQGAYLLIHGTGDDNVHPQHTYLLSNKLIEENKQFTQFLYPDRSHGISGGQTRAHLFEMITNFILREL